MQDPVMVECYLVAVEISGCLETGIFHLRGSAMWIVLSHAQIYITIR